MSSIKKKTRQEFRDAVFARDKNKCRICSAFDCPLDAHHITDRSLMENGGYVPENGISLCEPCHEKAEVFHNTGTALPGWEPEHLYAVIGSSYELAVIADKKKRKIK